MSRVCYLSNTINEIRLLLSQKHLFSSSQILREQAPAKSGANYRYKPTRGVSIGAFIALNMDEQTVRAWLKDQQDRAETLAQQQAATFQLQFDALRAELQATRGLLQNRHGGGGEPGILLPRSMHLDVPKFTGDDPDSWIFAITEYFTLLNTPADQRLKIVGFSLEGAAAEWFRWMSKNGLITDWDRFVESVKNCFGPSNMKIHKVLCRSCYNLVLLKSTNGSLKN